MCGPHCRPRELRSVLTLSALLHAALQTRGTSRFCGGGATAAVCVPHLPVLVVLHLAGTLNHRVVLTRPATRLP